jgi:hypothetical protein
MPSTGSSREGRLTIALTDLSQLLPVRNHAIWTHFRLPLEPKEKSYLEACSR